MNALAQLLLIVALIVALPFYGLWIYGGKIADRRGQRAVVRGNSK